MESLALPQELLWDGKSEPTSPSTSELFPITDSISNHWIYDDNFANGITLNDDDPYHMKSELELTENLINCSNLIIELTEMKDHWNGGKVQLESEPLDYPIETVIAHPNLITKVQNPFDVDAFNLIGLNSTVFTQLTPPHSPPQNGASSAFYAPTHSTASLPEASICYNDNASQQLPTVQTATLPPVEPTPVPVNTNSNSFFPWSGSVDGTIELNPSHVPEINDEKMSEMIDEFVNTRAQEIKNWIQCDSSSSCSALSTTDEEWLQESSMSSAGSSPSYQHFASDDAKDDQASGSTKSSKKRTRPYGRGVEDRKIRKKEQNKNAATRYRQKKKLEMEIVLSEEQQLEKRNQELQRTLAEKQREAKYLRALIREFYQKGK